MQSLQSLQSCSGTLLSSFHIETAANRIIANRLGTRKLFLSSHLSPLTCHLKNTIADIYTALAQKGMSRPLPISKRIGLPRTTIGSALLCKSRNLLWVACYGVLAILVRASPATHHHSELRGIILIWYFIDGYSFDTTPSSSHGSASSGLELCQYGRSQNSCSPQTKCRTLRVSWQRYLR